MDTLQERSSAVSADERCKECQTSTPIASLTLGYCQRCVQTYRDQNLWCNTHGPTFGKCLAEKSSPSKQSRALDRLRGPSASERLTAGLDRDAEEAAGRIKGILSLCGRELTTSEVERVRAQLRAELLSFQIKATEVISQEWFDMIAVRGISH